MTTVESESPTRTRRLWAAFSPQVEHRGARWSGFGSQIVLVTIAALLYFGVRMVTKEADDVAFENARRIIEFERRIGVEIEQWAQALILDHHTIVTFFNWVYIWLHWPVIIGALLVLYRFDTRGYVLFRNSLFVSGALGLMLYVSFPVAPPRFLDGFTDTVAELSTSYRFLQPPAIVNKYAAMPSLHVGWNLLAGIALYGALRRAGVFRFLPLVSPILMVAAVVFTANHYVVDAFVGAVVAFVGLYGGRLLTDWTEQRATGEPTDEPDAQPLSGG